MIFNSIAFAVFLPVVFLLYWFVFNRNLKGQNLFVVAASYFFYAWWDWRFLFLVIFTSLCTYAAGILIGRYRETPRKAKAVHVANIVVNLLVLGVFKYYDFFASSFADAFLGGKADGLLLHLVLPVGISFYTFKALSYTIDVYRGKMEPTQDIVVLAAYVAFFPQLLAGPIERATALIPQFEKPRTFEYETGVDGLRQILWGLFKKMVIADNCAVYVDRVFSTYPTQAGSTLLLAAVLYTFQIYGAFSGYSDIAIGTGKLFGIKSMRNFNVPYFSRDIAEFWRRWHISLTSWFRDYVYIPLGGNRKGKVRQHFNLMVTMLLGGLWHGAAWTFVVWGAGHGIALCIHKLCKPWLDTIASTRFTRCVSWLLTFGFVAFLWIFFRANTFQAAGQIISGIVTDFEWAYLPVFLQRRFTWCLMLAIIFGLHFVPREVWDKLRERFIAAPWWLKLVIFIILIQLVLQFASATVQPFLYAQF